MSRQRDIHLHEEVQTTAAYTDVLYCGALSDGYIAGLNRHMHVHQHAQGNNIAWYVAYTMHMQQKNFTTNLQHMSG